MKLKKRKSFDEVKKKWKGKKIMIGAVMKTNFMEYLMLMLVTCHIFENGYCSKFEE